MLDAQPRSDAAPVPPEVLDPACLAQLRSLDPQGGSGFLIKVLETYQRSLDRYLAQAESAYSASEWLALSQSAHALKSASASVGAQQLARQCAALEDACRVQDAVRASQLMPVFLDEVARARAAMAAALHEARA